jgi:hypothetical protein
MHSTMRIFLAGSLLGGSPAAMADSDYERGYRDGYGRGYEAGREASRKDGYRDGRGTYLNPSRLPAGIVVTSATYGDGRRYCDLTSWAVQQFNRRTSANVAVTNELCGDPAPGKRKSLEVEYLCRGEAKTASAYEHRSLSITCY